MTILVIATLHTLNLHTPVGPSLRPPHHMVGYHRFFHLCLATLCLASRIFPTDSGPRLPCLVPPSDQGPSWLEWMVIYHEIPRRGRDKPLTFSEHTLTASYKSPDELNLHETAFLIGFQVQTLTFMC